MLNCLRIVVLSCAALLGAAGPQAVAAEEEIVARCLAASFYPDGSSLFRLCVEAGNLKDLPDRTRAGISLQMGQAYYFAHYPALAMPFLDEAIKLDPSMAQAYRRRGWSHFMLGHATDSLSDFTEFLALSPEDPDASFAMAFARNGFGGSCETAARDYEQIIKQHPDHHITRYNLAVIYRCLDGHMIRQLEEFSKIIAAGRAASADVAYYTRAGAGDFDFYAMIRAERAGIYMNLDQPESALADYTWLVETYPKNALVRVNRSAAKHQLRDTVGALEDAEAAVVLSPDYPAAQIAKLRALKRIGRNEEVISYATDVMGRGYTSRETPSIHFWRASALKDLGLRREAIEDFNRAMAGDVWNVWAVHTQLRQSGYTFGPEIYPDSDEPPDFRAKEFVNALEACMIDPECFQ